MPERDTLRRHAAKLGTAFLVIGGSLIPDIGSQGLSLESCLSGRPDFTDSSTLAADLTVFLPFGKRSQQDGCFELRLNPGAITGRQYLLGWRTGELEIYTLLSPGSGGSDSQTILEGVVSLDGRLREGSYWSVPIDGVKSGDRAHIVTVLWINGKLVAGTVDGTPVALDRYCPADLGQILGTTFQ